MLEAESCCTVVHSEGHHEEREENFCCGSMSARGIMSCVSNFGGCLLSYNIGVVHL